MRFIPRRSARPSTLDLGELSLPKLTERRELLVQTLVELAADEDASAEALRLGAGQREEVERNATLWTSPTRPALDRYTGVLFDALDARSFTRVQRAKAYARLAIGPASFGAARRRPTPADRCPAGRSCPASAPGGLRAPELSSALEAEATGGWSVDLRSGIYEQLGPAPGALVATVLTEQPTAPARS